MSNAKATHESRNLFLEGPVGRLEAILWKPPAPARLAALVCHPHPLFGGTMHNKVVYQAAKSLDRARPTRPEILIFAAPD